MTLYSSRPLRKALAALCLGCAIALAAYRGPTLEGGQGSLRAPGTVEWSEAALAGLRAEGVPVFVDVTADWCITCLANEQAVLFTERARAAFERHGVVYMVADWTDYDDNIGGFVKSHGRNGIPLYVMYPADPDATPFLLPQLLTHTILEDALIKVSE